MTPNYHYELYEKYANSSASSPPKIGEVNVKLTNTISQRDSLDNNKPIYYAKASDKPGVITVRPFLSINEELQPNSVFKPINIGPL